VERPDSEAVAGGAGRTTRRGNVPACACSAGAPRSDPAAAALEIIGERGRIKSMGEERRGEQACDSKHPRDE
jgi:hypothetical protein